MMSAAEMNAISARADQGYLLLWVFTAVLVLLGWRMARWPWLQRQAARLGAWLQRPHWLLAIVALGALLRLPRLFESFWYDEAFTARIAALPLEQFLPAVRADVHPPGFYALDWLTAQILGHSEAALRFPAFLAGLALIVYGYRLALALNLGPRVAYIFALLIAVLPAPLYYSAEARGYTLLAVLVFGALIGLAQRRPWVFALHAAPLPLIHNIGYVYLGVFGVVYLINGRSTLRPYSRAGVWFVLAGALAVLPGLVWLPSMLAQTGDISDGFWLKGMNLGLFLSAYTDGTVNRQIVPELAGFVMAAVMAGSLLAVWHSRRWLLGYPNGRLLAVLVFGVPGALALASVVWAPVYLTRALIPAALGMALLWAILLADKPLTRLAIAPALVAALVSSYLPSIGRFNMRAAVETCTDARITYATSIPAAMFAAYYLPQARLIVWDEAGDLNQTLQRDAFAAYGLTTAEMKPPAAGVCILQLDTPNTTDAERAHLAELTAGRAARIEEYAVNPFYIVRVIEL